MKMTLQEQRFEIVKRLASMCDRWIEMRAAKEDDVRAQQRILESPEAQTDIRENAVYQIAKDKFSQLQLDIKNLTNKIDSFQLFDLNRYQRTGFIGIGSTVRLRLIEHNREFVVLIVPADLGSAMNKAVSIKSKVGEALLGKVVGDTVSVKTRVGVLSYVVEEVY